MKDHFRNVTVYPARKDANGVLMRLIDGLGYRFYWATEGLTPEDLAFSPGGGCMTIGDLAGHVWGLVNWVHNHFLGKSGEPPAAGLEGGRDQVFRMLYAVRAHVEAIDEQALFDLQIGGMPFWHAINGPLSDALSHVGQIAAFRRINGHPVPEHHVFLAHEKEAPPE